MKYCIYCGSEVTDDLKFCLNCGKPIKKAPTSSGSSKTVTVAAKRVAVKPAATATVEGAASDSGGDRVDLTAVKDSVSETANKAVEGAKNLGAQISKAVADNKVAIRSEIEEKAKENKEAQQRYREQKRVQMADGTRYMSSEELWSWLKQSSKRQIFYSEESADLTEDEYMQKVQEKLEERNVPAEMEARTIEWDRSNIKRRHYFIRPHTDISNPLSCLVQFEHVGKFTFIEEKTFITPPDLPEVPEKPMKYDVELTAKMYLWAVGFIIAGLFAMISGHQVDSFSSQYGYASSNSGTGIGLGLILILLGIIAGIYLYQRREKNKVIEEHNQKCMQQELAWNNAWSNWKTSIFRYSFQEDINGQLSRIFDSVFETIKQVNKEVFANAPNVIEEETNKMNELEELIARRQNEYR